MNTNDIKNKKTDKFTKSKKIDKKRKRKVGTKTDFIR
jgi:hypothetical protein